MASQKCRADGESQLVMRVQILVIVGVVAVMTSLGATLPQAPSDSGTVLVSLIERPIGKETYELRPDADGAMLTSTLDLLERGGALRFSSSLRLTADLSGLVHGQGADV